MKKSNHQFLLAIAAFAMMAIISFAGCANNPVVSEEPADVNFLSRNPEIASKIIGDSAFESTFIGPEGGTLTNLDVELTFPAGALENVENIFIDIPDIYTFENNFGTHGLQFKVPVKVVMSYRDADLSGVNETTITIAWYNENTGHWDPVECRLDTVNKTVTAFLDHFSAYALISD